MLRYGLVQNRLDSAILNMENEILGGVPTTPQVRLELSRTYTADVAEGADVLFGSDVSVNRITASHRVLPRPKHRQRVSRKGAAGHGTVRTRATGRGLDANEVAHDSSEPPASPSVAAHALTAHSR